VKKKYPRHKAGPYKYESAPHEDGLARLYATAEEGTCAVCMEEIKVILPQGGKRKICEREECRRTRIRLYFRDRRNRERKAESVANVAR
jgi:hypothetical protein